MIMLCFITKLWWVTRGGSWWKLNYEIGDYCSPNLSISVDKGFEYILAILSTTHTLFFMFCVVVNFYLDFVFFSLSEFWFLC